MKLGWCMTGHHACKDSEQPVNTVPQRGCCPGHVNCGSDVLVCDCPCHGPDPAKCPCLYTVGPVEHLPNCPFWYVGGSGSVD